MNGWMGSRFTGWFSAAARGARWAGTRPGRPCRVSWGGRGGVVRGGGSGRVRVERREAFFMHQGGAVIGGMLGREGGRFSPARQTLLELLHPTHLGHKFQVLAARRI